MAKIKGSHTALKTGMLAGEEIAKKVMWSEDVEEVPEDAANREEAEAAALAAANLVEVMDYSDLSSEHNTDGGKTIKDLEITDYEDAVKASWVWDELQIVRNVQPSFK